MRGIADARRLWARLDDETPIGPANPDGGCAVEVTHYDKMGR